MYMKEVFKMVLFCLVDEFNGVICMYIYCNKFDLMFVVIEVLKVLFCYVVKMLGVVYLKFVFIVELIGWYCVIVIWVVKCLVDFGIICKEIKYWLIFGGNGVNMYVI